MGEADLTLNQTDEKPPDSGLVPGEDSVVWSHEVEVCLFHAMIGHKPVGKRLANGISLLAATQCYQFSPVFSLNWESWGAENQFDFCRLNCVYTLSRGLSMASHFSI